MNAGVASRRGTPVRVVVSGPDGHVSRAVLAGLADEPTVEVTGEIRAGTRMSSRS
jgi:hypothetical protein